MSESEGFGDRSTLRDRENTARGEDIQFINNHSTVVERSILEENSLEEEGGDLGVYRFTGRYILIQTDTSLDDDKGSSLAFGHILAGDNQMSHKILRVSLIVIFLNKLVDAELFEYRMLSAKHDKGVSDFLLEDYNESEETDIDEATEDGREHIHIESSDDDPEDEEGQNTKDDISCHSAAYHTIDDKHKVGTDNNVNDIYEPYFEE